jgi:hypothetical protein
MLKNRCRFLLLTGLTMLIAATGTALSGETKGSGGDDGVLRVGTFDNRAVALAYGRSEPFLSWVKGLHQRAAKARESNDEALLKEIEREAVEQQERLHKQVFGGASVDDILEKMKASLPGVARAAGVDLIVKRPETMLYQATSVEVVDISREMADSFNPTKETRKILEQLLKTPPVDAGTFEHDHTHD